MNENATIFPTAGGAFMTTHWSVVSDFALHETAPDRAEAALTRLCRDYWPPLYRFVRRRGYSRDDAKDLTQGFFAYLIEKKAYTAPDRNKGRFRTFLLHLLKRYLGAARAHQSRQKRGGGEGLISMDGSQLDALERVFDDALLIRAPLDEKRLFEWNWATALVSRAMEALSAEYASEQKVRIFAELRPFLTGGVGLPTHEAAAARLKVSVETLRSHLFRLRGRYRALLRTEVLRTVPRERDIDDELRYLCRVLIAGA
ncbi:MAG: RNA polymerase subunit sigma-24 [Chthoniobacterales bacterium]